MTSERLEENWIFAFFWKKWIKFVDLGDTTSFLDNFCWSNWDIVRVVEISRKNCRVVLRNGRTCEKVRYKILRTDKSKTESWCKDLAPCFDVHHFKKELESVEKLSNVCSQILMKYLYLTRIDRRDISSFVNKLTRSVTKCIRACDRRLARLTSYIHHTKKIRQYYHVRNTTQHCRLTLFQDSDFTGDHEDSKSTSEGILCIFGSRTIVHISWICKKQTSVTHDSTESQIFSLHTDLRMNGSLLLTYGMWG